MTPPPDAGPESGPESGPDTVPDTVPETGITADSSERYERAERIATGGMGEVWRARDTVLGREVAVKVLRHEYADDPTFRARFAAEARHAAGLHHPGIASVFDYGVLAEGDTPYLVMELVDGKPLSELLAQGRPFDPEQARLLVLQVAEALAVAHAAGVVHRDVKPANLLVSSEGQVKITDFGIARAVGSVAITQTGQIIGTPHYLSPEQAHGNSASAASDVYALGVVLFECLTGRRPFAADTPIATALAHIQKDVPELPDTVPPALAAVVARALAKDPAERYANGGELAAALRAAAPDVPPVAAVPPEQTQVLAATGPVAAAPVAAATTVTSRSTTTAPPAPPAGADHRRRWPLYAGLLLLLLLLVALLVAHPWSGDTPASSGSTDASTRVKQPDTVRVRRAAYVGHPVDEVTAALHDKGLKVRTEAQDNPGDQVAGSVADLGPTGKVAKGTTIVLQVWGNPPASEPTSTPTPTPTQTEPAAPDQSKPDHGKGQDKPKPEKPTKSEKPKAAPASPSTGRTTTSASGAAPGPTSGAASGNQGGAKTAGAGKKNGG